jgi:hypothetical protein
MGVPATVVFTDLHGSTAVFEALGNAVATEAITRITTWIAQQCELANGRVVKTLGDGVLVLFPDGASAVKAVVELQRVHFKRVLRDPSGTSMPIRIGMAFRMLGPIAIRGRAEPCTVYQIEWHEDAASEFLTMQGHAEQVLVPGQSDVLGRQVELTWRDHNRRFQSFELPVHIGRVRNVEFMVNDPRVSRTHACLEWRNGSVVMVDLSSYGSWVRFSGASGSDVLLRRDECVLHGEGDLALGASFADPTVPTVHFKVT